MPTRITLALAFALAGTLAASCATFNEARPLEPGEHEVAVTVGGPLVDVPGVGDIPMPHVTLEGRHGIAHRLDVGYGVHLLPLVFGVAGAHVGAGLQLPDQPNAFVPAVTLAEQLYGFTNLIDARKQRKDFWGMSQSDVTASWSFLGDQLAFAGGSLYWVTSTAGHGGENVFLAPVAGVQIAPGLDWLRLQLEAKWVAPDINEKFAVVDWIAPFDQGGIVVDAGIAVKFGGTK